MLGTLGTGPPCQFWNVTPQEIATSYPCEDHALRPFTRYLRGVTVQADADTVFRWVCQIKVAPYSYDWLDNAGRRSPRELTPDADRLELGQAFAIMKIVAFEEGRHITGVATPDAARIFGPLSMTYDVRQVDDRTSRLVGCIAVSASSTPRRMWRWALGCGDLVMMRKQLLTLKECAESTVTA